MNVLVALLTLALAAAALCQDGSMVSSLPENPHQSFYIEGMCTVCHSNDREGAVDPHGFVLPIIEICLRESCHTQEQIGRSHPVGIDVNMSDVVEDVPEFLPLEDDDLISCGSCHQPHGEWLAASRCFPNQQPKYVLVESGSEEARETAYYQSYYLRIPGDPEEGFTAMCNSCHPR